MKSPLLHFGKLSNIVNVPREYFGLSIDPLFIKFVAALSCKIKSYTSTNLFCGYRCLVEDASPFACDSSSFPVFYFSLIGNEGGGKVMRGRGDEGKEVMRGEERG